MTEARLLLNCFEAFNYVAYPRMLHDILYCYPFLGVDLEYFLHQIVKMVLFFLFFLIQFFKFGMSESFSKTPSPDLPSCVGRSNFETIVWVEEEIYSFAFLNHI